MRCFCADKNKNDFIKLAKEMKSSLQMQSQLDTEFEKQDTQNIINIQHTKRGIVQSAKHKQF